MESLQQYLSQVRSPYHAVKVAVDYLVKNGFKHVRESDELPMEPAVYTRDGTAFLAYIPGTDFATGFESVQTHVDSPVIRLRQDGEIKKYGDLYKLPCENYSSLEVSRILDRKLGLGGRVSYLSGGKAQVSLLSSKTAFFVPSLAPHMLRNPGDPKDWVPSDDDFCVCCAGEVEINGKSLKLSDKMKIADLLQQAFSADCICASELDFQAVEINEYGTLLEAARLDNLASVYASVKALIASKGESLAETRLIFAFSHEEIGSATRAGAHGPALRDFWFRLTDKHLSHAQALQAFTKSFNVSADGAHACHPEKGASSCLEPVPVIGEGFCLKMSQRQNYAFSDYLEAVAFELAQKAGVKIQKWVNKTYKAGGGTIANVVASDADCKIIDCGVPLLAMHSCCETLSLKDLQDFQMFFEQVFKCGNQVLGAVMTQVNE